MAVAYIHMGISTSGYKCRICSYGPTLKLQFKSEESPCVQSFLRVGESENVTTVLRFHEISSEKHNVKLS